MREVILYIATQKLVTSYSSSIPMYHMQAPRVRSRNSDDMFVAKEVDVEHLPIQRFCWEYGGLDKGEIFFAFDNQLELILNNLVREGVDKQVSEIVTHSQWQVSLLKQELKTLQSLSLWGTVVLKFKQFWRSKT